jgi:TolB-like protein
MASLLAELKRRNVYKVAFAYLILAWLVLQITDIVAPALFLPDWTMSLVTFLGIIGFPFAMLFVWAFELTPEGIKRTEEVHPDESISHETGAWINRLIFGMMTAAVVILLVDRFLLTGGGTENLESAANPVVEQAVEATADGKPRSIAVLPFVNMSNDPEQEYFSDGISEELLNSLARIRELRVAARTSSFAFKGKNQDITDIGRQLKVETVLEGSVRKSGKRLRITAQLINVEDGYHLWSDTYDRDLTDIFVIQDEISAAIVGALRVHLTDSEGITSGATVASEQAVEGFQYFLLARHELRKRTQESVERSVKLYDQSLALSPDYAPAIAGKALAVYFNSEVQYGTIPRHEAAVRAAELANRALRLRDDLPDAHGTLGLIAMDEMRFTEALEHVDRAVEINPSLGILHSWRGVSLGQMGRTNEAKNAGIEAFRLDPMHPVAQNNMIAGYLSMMDLDGADAFYASLGGDSEWMVDALMCAVKTYRGDLAGAYGCIESVADRIGQAEQALYRVTEFKFDWLKELAVPAGLLPMDRWEFVSMYESPERVIEMSALIHTSNQSELEVIVPLASAYARLGESDQALAILDRRSEPAQRPSKASGDEIDAADGIYLEAWILQQLGNREAANQLIADIAEFMQGAENNGLYRPHRDWALIYALRGESDRVIAELEAARQINNLHWYEIRNPVYRDLRDNPEFIAVFDRLDVHINTERAKLGWPPAEATPL